MRHVTALAMSVFLVCPLCPLPASAAEKDPCKDSGILVRNFSTRDLWYGVNNGPCTILVKDHNFHLRPGDTAEVFSDMVCKKLYNKEAITYKSVRSKDKNGDCRVKIRPGGSISDM